MDNITQLNQEESVSLRKRYLLWLYKNTREALDRVDRKFTQLYIDRIMLKHLARIEKVDDKENWDKLVGEFEEYINKKERDAIALKYTDSGKSLKADYLFMKNKFRSIENIITGEFGAKELKRINLLYEKEMERRIAEEREHR